MLDHLQEAEVLARSLGDQHRLGRITALMVVPWRVIGDFDAALKFGQEALAIAWTLGDRSIEAVATNYLGETHLVRGELMKCPAGTPWAECLNAKCTVDPADSSKATCACETKVQTGEWVTWAGNCNTQSCIKAFLNGTTVAEMPPGVDFLVKELDLKKSPVNWCPADAR
jgi:hypothetical protein